MPGVLDNSAKVIGFIEYDWEHSFQVKVFWKSEWKAFDFAEFALVIKVRHKYREEAQKADFIKFERGGYSDTKVVFRLALPHCMWWE